MLPTAPSAPLPETSSREKQQLLHAGHSDLLLLSPPTQVQEGKGGRRYKLLFGNHAVPKLGITRLEEGAGGFAPVIPPLSSRKTSRTEEPDPQVPHSPV